MANESSRRGPRVGTEIPAILVDSAGAQIPVVVIDISMGGFRLRCGQPLVPGEAVDLKVEPDSIYAAEIEWSSRTEAGGRFLHSVDMIEGVPR